MRPLVKHTIIIWTEPGKNGSISRAIAELAQDATDGNSYCSHHFPEVITDPQSDPDWDGTEFFEDGQEHLPAVEDVQRIYQ